MKTGRQCLARIVVILVLGLCLPPPTARAASVTVNSTTDVSDGDTSSIPALLANPGLDGVISLREAIEAANNDVGPDTIGFDLSGCMPCYIYPQSPLPELSGGGTTIDGDLQPITPPAGIFIDGSSAGNAHGLLITSADNVIHELSFLQFSWDGIRLSGSGATRNTVYDCSTIYNGHHGVALFEGAHSNTVGPDNIISSNGQNGVQIHGEDSDSNKVYGNHIGVNLHGDTAFPNGLAGVSITEGADYNNIGGPTAGTGNLISGNGSHGISITGDQTQLNLVQGNLIGTDRFGSAALPNAGDGIRVDGDAFDNTIGGDTPEVRNVISGNTANGITFSGGAAGNVVTGNYIGLTADGVGTLGNGSFGILIGDSPLNVIGGDAPGEGNVISGNVNGISVSNPGSTGNVIKGNFIGPDATGAAGPGNAGLGVVITAGAQDNTVGPGNVIAYNGWNGVRVIPASSTGNVITKNSIHHNYGDGIALLDGANNNIQPPVITSISAGFPIVIQGTACPFCIVEIFQNSDADGEGESYVSLDYADGSGAFVVLPSHLSKPYLTATATDSTDGTSEFSAVFASGIRSVFLPVVWRGN